MVHRLGTYKDHIKYWSIILFVIIVFGALLGSVGVSRLQNLPALSVIDETVKQQLQTVSEIDRRVTTLDSRITVIEGKISTAEIVRQNTKQ